jgi:tetratricopeptide (TPR) repeat protein
MTSPGPDMATQIDERLVNAPAASQRHAWQDAFDAFTAADAESPLGGADLEALAEAAFFTANIDTRERSLERAVKAHTAEGDRARAGAVALGISIDLLLQGRTSIASAWIQGATRLIEGEPEGYAHGYLALARGMAAQHAGRFDEALSLAEEAVPIGMSATHPDLHAIALISLGRIKLGAGSAADGLAFIEEATASSSRDAPRRQRAGQGRDDRLDVTRAVVTSRPPGDRPRSRSRSHDSRAPSRGSRSSPSRARRGRRRAAGVPATAPSARAGSDRARTATRRP